VSAPTILLVEDSQLVTDALRILFDSSGYNVLVAATVDEAVSTGTSENIDVMLLDLTLPDGDGLDVMKTLRERISLPRATLAMTGHNDTATRRACIEAGCADVLLKPVPIGELLRQVERLLA
jgi:DNA-binding response OmpR family regulator